MAGALDQEMTSPNDIENGITSTQTVTWDPFTDLPKEIYLEIFDKLDNPADKKNFMNAHVKFYALFKVKRTLFLFQDVLKEMSKTNIQFRIIGRRFRTTVPSIRLVCRDWDLAVQTIFQLNVGNFQLDYKDNEGNRFGVGRELSTMSPCYNWTTSAETMENDLRMFSLTHLPSKNPFLSRKIELFPSFHRPLTFPSVDEEESERYKTAVDSLLEKYGRHFWHCNMPTDGPAPETCQQMAKWLCLMPELKTFDVECVPDLYRQQLTLAELMEIQDMEFVQPELNKLEVLKSNCLPSVVFNKLFGNLRELEKIQIFVAWDGSTIRDYEIPPSRESLKEASFTFKMKELPDFLEYLVRSKPFPNLKKLGIDDKMGPCDNICLPWPEWKTTFKILEEKLPALEELSFRLPKAVLDVDKETAKSQSLSATLNLPKLKKLWITLPNLASIDFLLPSGALVELNVFLEFYQFNVESAGLGKREKIRFNVDLSTLWESNIWDVFPKLRALNVDALNSFNYRANRHRYEKIGQKRKYTINSYSGRSS